MTSSFSVAQPLRIPALTSCRDGSELSRVFRCSAYRVRRTENVEGDLYVDSSCIDCDACRWVAPSTFRRAHGKSAVHTQPKGDDRNQALAAAAACPTGSIRSTSAPSAHVRASTQFPMPVHILGGADDVRDVYYLGLTSVDTFGASSWLVMCDGYGVMFDVPRYSLAMAERIRSLCADVRYIVFSHQDDVDGHAKWAQALGATRIIHEAEANVRQRTNECERLLCDEEFPVELGDGLVLYHVPGHTKGSIVMYHEGSRSLFTGDHISYSSKRNSLSGSPMYCFYSWQKQIQSVEALADIPFLHGWPGHGGPFHFSDDDDRRSRILLASRTMQAMR